MLTFTLKTIATWEDFPGSPVVKTPLSTAGNVDSIPDQGIKIPHASQPKNQNIKQKQYCNKNSIKTLKKVHVKKILNLKKSPVATCLVKLPHVVAQIQALLIFFPKETPISLEETLHRYRCSASGNVKAQIEPRFQQNLERR